MKTLKDVAKVYKDQALKAINPGVPYNKYKTGSSKAFKTGRMFKEVASRLQVETEYKQWLPKIEVVTLYLSLISNYLIMQSMYNMVQEI